MEEWIAEIESQHSKADMKQLAVEYGLAKPGPLRILKWDRHVQTPQDIYHFMARKTHTLLEATFNSFNLNSENAFLKHWRDIEKPANWLAMLMPFILRRFLKPQHIKTETLNNWHTRQSSAASKLCVCWTIEAKVLKLAFSLTMTESHYKELQETLENEREMLIQANIVVCYDKNFIDISLNNKWNNNKVKNAGLSKNLDVKHPFFRDFHRAYADYLNSKLKFNVGDIVELLEEIEGTAYAKINSIF
ncbi:22984_t:CDS:2 [Cetraspora pellucida]|uniref:22984_t:CDS:1 n=1 Tax=Cetraspora pellucida TaxID=1433469 RepID=A0A9N9DGB1_9GLOM|nr:22984_t:CDS:2 [Cetraspora pellucida]